MEAKIQQTECTRVYTGILRIVQPANRNGNGCTETLERQYYLFAVVQILVDLFELLLAVNGENER